MYIGKNTTDETGLLVKLNGCNENGKEKIYTLLQAGEKEIQVIDSCHLVGVEHIGQFVNLSLDQNNSKSLKIIKSVNLKKMW